MAEEMHRRRQRRRRRRRRKGYKKVLFVPKESEKKSDAERDGGREGEIPYGYAQVDLVREGGKVEGGDGRGNIAGGACLQETIGRSRYRHGDSGGHSHGHKPEEREQKPIDTRKKTKKKTTKICRKM
jgi:hypothetical protein